MIDFDFFSALTVCIAHVAAIVVLTLRVWQTRNVAIIGIIGGLAIVALCYVGFVYNAYMDQSNAPLRYYLRLGNGVVAFSIGLFSLLNWYTERRVRAVLQRVRNGGPDES